MDRFFKIQNLISSYQVISPIFNEYRSDSVSSKELTSLELVNIINWYYDFEKISFELLSSNSTYTNLSNGSFKFFCNTIKRSFQDYFVDYVTLFFRHCISYKNEAEAKKLLLHVLLPIKLNHHDNEYTFCLMNVIPNFYNGKVFGFFFMVFPIKKYNKEYLEIAVHDKFIKDENLSRSLRSQIEPPEILTQKQKLIFWHVLLSHSSQHIAKVLKLKPEAIYKMNIRITDRLNKFFEIEFNNVNDAANFYAKCFLTN